MDTIFKTANTVRKWCLEMRYVFHRTGYDSDLTGMCAIASAKLFDLLDQLGYNPRIAVAELDDSSHVFVLVDDFIVDVTATQFGRQPIEIVHEKSVNDWYWQVCYEFESIERLIRHQKRNGWPSYQTATPEKVFYNANNLH